MDYPNNIIIPFQNLVSSEQLFVLQPRVGPDNSTKRIK